MVPNQVRSRHESLVTMWWSLKPANDFIHRKFNTSGGFNMPIFIWHMLTSVVRHWLRIYFRKVLTSLLWEMKKTIKILIFFFFFHKNFLLLDS